ncbi:MAG: CehA/McbA family metallohydrolase [Sandaracinaceae bacterium]|nr:CehA/McbA family metallohydrolase [Sandaracinaceae bacterium]
MSDEVILPQSPTRYAREARLAIEDGELRLHCLVWDGARERHERARLDTSLEVVSVEALREDAALVALTVSDRPRVVTREEASAVDTVAEAGDERVWITHEQGASRVILVRAGVRHEVFFARCTAMAPSLAIVPEGTWIAFHHNRREDTGEADLTKWITLRFVDREGRVHAPAEPMRELDRDASGEEQGFEFPTIVGGSDGSVALFGRGSHRFFRQDLDARGWSARAPLPGDDGTWGCRGRRVSVVQLEHALVLARRDKRGLVLSRMEAPTGGAPRLVPADVVLETRPHRDVPVRPRASDPAGAHGLRTLFGDIHQHSAHSDGCGAAAEPYLRARHVYGDDFGALSDHESFLGKRIGPGEWALLRAVADAHDEPGRFVALHAYEWTGRMHPGPGHKVVYPVSAAHRIVSRDAEPTGQGLLAALREEGALAVPHHVGWTGADEAAHDEALQPVWEICSCHGCYLSEGHVLGQRGALVDQMIDRVLSRGRRFGFIACSDGHGLLHHHGVGRKRDPFRCGLTAVLAREVSREGVLEAIRARRCYATSGVPIFLDVRADGDRPMGSVLRATSITVRVHAAGACPLREIALVGPDGLIARAVPNATEGVLQARVEASWSYARVVQDDGEMAWSSPIFLER